MKKIAFRVDASSEIGFGHLSRCVSFANILSQGGYAPIFITSVPANLFESLKIAHGFEFYQLADAVGQKQAAEAFEDIGNIALLVCDGYHFTANDIGAFSQNKVITKLLVIDDFGRLLPSVDFVLNQNIGSESLYTSSERGGYLLGPRYLLLRDEFLFNYPPRHYSPQRSVAISFGGSDQTRRLIQLLEVLNNIVSSGTRVNVLLGGTPRRNIEQMLAKWDYEVELIEFTDRVIPYFVNTDLVISPSGSTIWELCKINKPFITYPLAENQKVVSEGVGRYELGEVVDFDDPVSMANAIYSVLENHSEQDAFRSNRHRYFYQAGMTLETFESEIGSNL